jgi:glutamate carboxypeptidase
MPVLAGTDLDRHVAKLTDWVRLESPTHAPEAVNAMMSLVAREVADAPVSVERIPGHDGFGDILVLRAGPRSDAAPVVVMSHLDTVHPIGTLESDLPVRLEGDRLYGPGVYDMKGGAYLALQAFKDVARGGTARAPLVFLLTPDEEVGSPTSRRIIEDLGRKAASVLVTEPARDGGRIVTSRKGVGRFEVVVEGRPAHSGSRHQDGRSAIREAARQILRIENMTDYGRGVTTTVGVVSGGTAMNVVPQNCRFSVDLRVETIADGEAYEALILGLAPHDPDLRVKVIGGMNRPPFERSEAIDRLFRHAHALAAEVGFELEDSPRVGGGSDGNFTAAVGAPTLDGLGIDGDGAHTLAEHALVSSLVPRGLLMRRLLETLG